MSPDRTPPDRTRRGVGIEVATGVVRAVAVAGERDLEVVAAAEFPFALNEADSLVLERLVRVRAELGDPTAPARLSWFPPGSTLQRLDVTGRTGPQLNELRVRLDADADISSTLLVDDGPRRWLYTIRWEPDDARRLEDLAERAGFVDVAIEPAPISLARAVDGATTFVRRLAGQEDTFEMALVHGLPAAAASVDLRGRVHPALDVGRPDVTAGRFDELLDDELLASELGDLGNDVLGDRARGGSDQPAAIALAGVPYPRYPDSDVRSAPRQAVALGAAVSAAGFGGISRPVDILAQSTGTDLRPWAIERISDLPDTTADQSPGALRRVGARLLPRRRRR